MDDENFEQIECEEEEVTEEAKKAEVLRYPSAPAPKEVEEHNVTHLPFRSWCPLRVSGKAQDRRHKKRDGQDAREVVRALSEPNPPRESDDSRVTDAVNQCELPVQRENHRSVNSQGQRLVPSA